MQGVVWQWTQCKDVSLHLVKICSMAFYTFKVVVITSKMFAMKPKTMWNSYGIVFHYKYQT